MKKTFHTIAIAIATFCVSCGHSHEHEGSDSHSSTATNVESKDTVNAYVCPMRCEGSGSMKEGLCSVCAMDLKTNPDFPGHESMAIGEEPVGGSPMVDSTVIATEDQHDHEGHDHHDGHNH